MLSRILEEEAENEVEKEDKEGELDPIVKMQVATGARAAGSTSGCRCGLRGSSGADLVWLVKQVVCCARARVVNRNEEQILDVLVLQVAELAVEVVMVFLGACVRAACSRTCF